MKQKLSVNLQTSENSTPLKINQNRCKSCQRHSKGWKECWGVACPLPQQCSFPSPEAEQSACVCGYSSPQTHTATLKTNGTQLWARPHTDAEKQKGQCCGRAWLHCCTRNNCRRERVNLWTGVLGDVACFWLWEYHISLDFSCSCVRCERFLLTRFILR